MATQRRSPQRNQTRQASRAKARHVTCTVGDMHQDVPSSASRSAAGFARETRGDAAVEYLFLIGTIALPVIAAFVAVGKVIVDNYTTMQNILVLPLP